MRGTVWKEGRLRQRSTSKRGEIDGVFEFSHRQDGMIREDLAMITFVSLAKILETRHAVDSCRLLRRRLADIALDSVAGIFLSLDQLFEGRKTIELGGDELIVLDHLFPSFRGVSVTHWALERR